MRGVILSRQAQRDLRRLGSREALARIRGALEELSVGGAGLDVKPLAGAAPWHRLRVGDYRIPYRPLEPHERDSGETGWLVARVVHRRDLERAVSTLR